MKMNVPVDDFFSECEPIHRKFLVCSHSLGKSLLKNSISLEKVSVSNYIILKAATEKTRYEGQGILIFGGSDPLDSCN